MGAFMNNLRRREEYALSQLRDTFGVKHPRPMQENLIEHVVAGGNLLAVLPTGWGKSTLYQVPALARAGVAIVVSPLISLMEDQVEGLRGKGIAARALHSRTNTNNYSEIVDSLEQGALKLLYISPKKLESGWLEGLTLASRISLIAIDEAHLIVDWGMSGFNRSYQSAYRGLRRRFPDAPIVATTGSATSATGHAIREAMGFQLEDIGRSLKYYREAPDRPEIRLDVVSSSSEKRLGDIVDRVKQMTREYWGKDEESRATGIIYTLTARDAERISEVLTRTLGMEFPYYHAKIEDDEDDEQSVFEDLRSKLERRVIPAIVSTSAAGMGIDIRGLRWALHDGMRTSIEEYWQQVGRIGREQSSLPKGSCTATLITAGTLDQIRWQSIQRWSSARTNSAELFRRREHLAYAYGDSTLCRKGFLAGYLGDRPGPDCGNCDNCISLRKGAILDTDFQLALDQLYQAAKESGYEVTDASLLSHPDFGLGLQLTRVGEALKVLFLDSGNGGFTKIINPTRLTPIIVASADEYRHTHSKPISHSAVRIGWTVCANKEIDAVVVAKNDVYFDLLVNGELKSVPSAICWAIEGDENLPDAMVEAQPNVNATSVSKVDQEELVDSPDSIRTSGSLRVSDDWRNDR
jgi:ATP-dependent DNA helicase RecQ